MYIETRTFDYYLKVYSVSAESCNIFVVVSSLNSKILIEFLCKNI